MLIFPTALVLAAVALFIVVAQHIGYFRRVRPPSFGAFLETGGWLTILLVAIGALGGGLRDPGTARVEAVAAAVGVLCVVGGWRLTKRAGRHDRG